MNSAFFTMTLNKKFELVKSSLLHKDTFLDLDIVVIELCAEKTELATLKSCQSIISTDTILAPLALSSQCKVTYYYCYKPRHVMSDCFKLQSKKGIRQYNQTNSKFGKAFFSIVVVATTESSSSSYSFVINKLFNKVDLDTLKQTLS